VIDPREQRYGWDGPAAALAPVSAGVVFHAVLPIDLPPDRVMILSFDSDVDAVTFAGWWGAEGKDRYAAFLDLHRVRL
jgi:hypothetical protein